jgi:hypothetical protein
MMESESHVAVDSYRARATEAKAAVWNYKGLEMIASPNPRMRKRSCRTAFAEGDCQFYLGSGSGAMCLRRQDMGFNPTGCDLVSEGFRLFMGR